MHGEDLIKSLAVFFSFAIPKEKRYTFTSGFIAKIT
jgi:hypothetical protein